MLNKLQVDKEGSPKGDVRGMLNMKEREKNPTTSRAQQKFKQVNL